MFPDTSSANTIQATWISLYFKYDEFSLSNPSIKFLVSVADDFNFVEVNGTICILLYDQDVDYVIQEYEEIEDKTSNLILPEEKKLILN